MRHKAMFISGVAVGFVAGSRAGRSAYDKLVEIGKQVVAHPKVQQAANSAQAKATDLAKTAAAKAPDYAKSAAASAAKVAQTQAAQVPQYVSNVKQAASSKLPPRLGGSAGTDAAADGQATKAGDDIAPDGNLIYPADSDSPSVNGIHYTPDTPS